VSALADALERQGATRDVVEWFRAQTGTAADVWAACPRADWLLGIAARAGAPRTKLVAAAAACAREALSSYADPPAVALAALDAAEKFARGELDAERCNDAGAAAEEQSLLAPSPGLAAAMVAATAAAQTALVPDEAPTAAVMAVESAVHEAGECALDVVLRAAQRKCADDVRRFLAWEDVAAIVG